MSVPAPATPATSTPSGPLDRAALVRSLRRGAIGFGALGLLAVALPRVSTLAVDLLVGALLVLAGAGGLALVAGTRGVFAARNAGILFALSVAAGVLLLVFPADGARLLTLLLVGLFVLEGAIKISIGLRLRSRLAGASWLIVDGALTLLLALVIGAGWPASGADTLGMLFGLNLLLTAASLHLTGRALRDG